MSAYKTSFMQFNDKIKQYKSIPGLVNKYNKDHKCYVKG